jgi:hypothetical protein
MKWLGLLDESLWPTMASIWKVRRIPPGDSQRQERPQYQHSDHTQAQEQQGMRVQHPSAPSTRPDQARRFRARASGATARRGFPVFLRLWGVETRSALHHRGDARHPLLASITLDRTMAQRTVRHGTVGRFENRHLRSPSLCKHSTMTTATPRRNTAVNTEEQPD